MGPVLLCARLGGMAVSAHRTQTRSVSAYRRPECLLKSRMCERHLSGSERAGRQPSGSTQSTRLVPCAAAACCRGLGMASLLPRSSAPSYSRVLLPGPLSAWTKSIRIVKASLTRTKNSVLEYHQAFDHGLAHEAESPIDARTGVGGNQSVLIEHALSISSADSVLR